METDRRIETTGSWRDLPVTAAMTEGVVDVDQGAPAWRVAEVMARKRIHAVVVTHPIGPGDDPRAAWGVISDLDLLGAGDTPWLTADRLARSPSLVVGPDETLARVARLMGDHRAGHVLVVAFDGSPLGVVSTLDVARAFARAVHTLAPGRLAG